MNKEFQARDTNPLLPLIGFYLTEGIDYLENVPEHSKIAVDSRWPNVEGIRADTDEDKLFPLSPRSIFSAISLSEALEMIAEAKDETTRQPELFLDCLRFTVPYSGVISPAFIDRDNNGDVYSAFDKVLGIDSRARSDILENAQNLDDAILLAHAGITDSKLTSTLNQIPYSSNPRWTPVRQAVEDYAERVSQNPTEISLKLRKLIGGA